MTTTVVNLKGRVRENAGAAPEGVTYIGKRLTMGGWRLAGSKWANPYKIGRDGDRGEVIEKYRAYLLGRPDLLAALPELRGKTLGCWCKGLACHGDVLAAFADA